MIGRAWSRLFWSRRGAAVAYGLRALWNVVVLLVFFGLGGGRQR